MAEFRGGGGGWMGFSEYMRDKTLKLAGQFDQRYDRKSDIFTGKTFWSTGRIEGVDFDIKQAITENGGVYEQYGLRRVSHIIASNVALSNQNWKKLIGGKFAQKTYCLVTPQWLEDSIKAGKSLPESDYLPECIRMKGTLDEFLGDSVARHIPEKSEDSLSYAIPDDSARIPRKLVRVDVEKPCESLAVVEELCYEILTLPYPVRRKGYLSVTHFGSVNVFSLDFSVRTTCLSEALMNELCQRDWSGVTKVSLTLFPGENNGTALDVFPTVHELPASASSSRLLSFIKALCQSNEDDVLDALKRVTVEAGTCTEAVILDAVSLLLRSRRLDVVRDISQALRRHYLKSSDIDTGRWVHQLLQKIQRVFQWENEGAKLML